MRLYFIKKSENDPPSRRYSVHLPEPRTVESILQWLDKRIAQHQDVDDYEADGRAGRASTSQWQFQVRRLIP